MQKKLLFHGLFWLAYCLLYALINSRYDGNFQRYFIFECGLMPARIAATYTAIFIIKYFKNRPNLLIFSSLVGVAILAGLCSRVVKFYFTVPKYFPESTIKFWHWRAFYDIFDVLLTMSLCLAAWLFVQNQQQQKQAETLRAEKTAAELRALKSQLQPHFLFNTLNNIYALARQQSPKTAPVTLKLAQMLRFVLYESQKTENPISTEIQILKDYLDLEKLRFDEERLRVETHFEVENPNFGISPLLFLSLTENAFKHGVSEQRAGAFVKIHLAQKANEVFFQIENSLPETHEKSEIAQNGKQIGLNNLQKTLNLVYPERHDLVVSSSEGLFCVKLSLGQINPK